MTGSSSDPLDPPAHLTSALRDARQVCVTAQRGLAHLLMIDTARLVRRVFPAAAHLVIDRDRWVGWLDGVHVTAVLDHDEQLLWSEMACEPPDWDDTQRDVWDDIQQDVALRLIESVGLQAPEAVWDRCGWLAPRLQRSDDAELYRTPLPTEALVQAVLTADTPPTKALRRRARFYNRNTRHLPAGRAVEFPALRIAGALVFAYLHPDRHVPTLCVSVDLDEAVPELHALPDGAVAIEVHVQSTPVFLAPHGIPPKPDRAPHPATG